MPEKRERDSALEQFTRMAAAAVLELLSRARLCGVTWGRMLASLVKAARSAPLRQASRTEFVPLAGEPLGFAPTSSSSSILADELQRMFRKAESHARSLTMLPALIPRDFASDERRAIVKLIGRLRDWRETFESHDGGPALASSLEGIVTSVGRDPLGFAGGSLLDETEERPLFVGDLGGVLLPRTPANAGERERLNRVATDLADRWTGLRLDHVRGCAEKAARLGAAATQVGVVVLSIGQSRASVVFECVKEGLVSHLFIDDSLEAALLRECAERSRLSLGASVLPAPVRRGRTSGR